MTTEEQSGFTQDGESKLAVRVDNEFGLIRNKNLPNHTASMAGRGNFIAVTNGSRYQWRTKQEVYRFIAHLEALAEAFLPDEDGEHSFDEVNEAVRNLHYPE